MKLAQFIFALILGFVASPDLQAADTSVACNDDDACNYLAEEPCEYDTCAGCNQPLACNYDASKSLNDGSCLFPNPASCKTCSWQENGDPNPQDGSGTLVDNDADDDGICDASDNCTDTNACNYDDPANLACVSKITYYHDEDEDGIGDYVLGQYCADGDNVPGNSTTTLGPGDALDNCTNPQKCGYDNALNTPCYEDADGDGLCDEPAGCTGPDCANFDQCTDTNAPNYDIEEFTANESCCDDLNNNQVCDDREIFGCTDDEACNYLIAANLDDGTCKYTGTTTGQSGSSTPQYAIGIEDDPCDACSANGDTVVVDPTKYALLQLDTLPGVTSNTFLIGEYIDNDADNDGICDANEIVGCDDADACNYAENATEPCYFDEATSYGVTPNGDACGSFCLYTDVCGECGGDGTDVDGDGLCDDTDNCLNTLACNYDLSSNEACQFLTECDTCAPGTDADNDGRIDDDNSDSDDDGLCDATADNCYDLTACNYDDPANGPCQQLDACGVCGGTGLDVDGDGLCDDVDVCTDVNKCNYDINIYPNNDACLDDTDGDEICDPYEITGCQDTSACNYDADATDNDADLCVYADDPCETCSGDVHDGTDTVVFSDSDGDGICDDVDLCSDETACNFDADPSEPCGTDVDGNGVCDTAEILGCKNENACNYNENATRDNGTCQFATSCQTCSGATDGTGTVQEGDSDFDGVCDGLDNCSDVTACNYIASTSQNAACSYKEPGKNCAGDCLSDTDNDGICEYDGADVCSDLAACNYADPANEPCLYRNSCGACTASVAGELGYDPDVYCDCELNVVDVLGNCGGGCTADVDGDGICDNVDPCLTPGESPDECGVCGGPGAIYECGCFELPAEACSCEPNGTVTYPRQGEDCDGNCLFGTVVVNGETICAFFDNAEPTELPTPTRRTATEDGRDLVRTDTRLLEEWIIKFDTLHSRMAKNLDDGSLTGASERLTIEEHILDKGKLDVLGSTRLSGFVQMDSNVVILGNLTVEQDATIKGTTFSRGGIETTSMNMSGDLSVGGATVIDSTLEVLQSTLLHDSLTALGAFTIGRDRVFAVDTLGNTQINGELTILDSLVATQSGTRLANLVAKETTVADLTATGDVTINNQLDVQDSVRIGGSVGIGNNTTIGGTLTVSGNSTLQNVTSTSIRNSGLLATDSISNSGTFQSGHLHVDNETTTGSLVVESDAVMRGSLKLLGSGTTPIFSVKASGGDVTGVAKVVGDLRMYPNQAAVASNTPTIQMTRTGGLSAAGLVSGDRLTATNATATSTLAGRLTVDRFTTLRNGMLVQSQGQNVFEITQDGSINLTAPSTVSGNMTVSGNLTLNAAASMNILGSSTLNSLSVTTTSSLGAMSATSGTFTGALSVGGAFKAGQGLYVGSQTGTVPSGFVAMLDGGPTGLMKGNGLAIKLNHSGSQPGGGNHYITFQNKNGTTIGEIRGETEDNWDDDAFKDLERREHAADVAFATTNLAFNVTTAAAYSSEAAARVVMAVTSFIPDSWQVFWPGLDWGDAPARSFKAILGGERAASAIRESIASGVDLVAAAAFLGSWDTANRGDWENGGVSYASGNGDYAEWLERWDAKEDLQAGQIVGIRNGKISLNTADADHVMVISTAPIVLGNEPPIGERERFEKVAFMGQVPVKVLGPVRSGDFIVPSGDEDGWGIAVHPEDIEMHQVDVIVGVAWEDGQDPNFNTVNLAVGLDHSATALRFLALQDKMEDLRWELDEVTALVMGRPMAAAPAATQATQAATNQPQTRDVAVTTGGTGLATAQAAQPAQTATTTSAPAASSIGDISKEEILAAVADVRDGKTPPKWMENISGRDMNTVISMVVDDYVQQAESDSRQEMEQIKRASTVQYQSKLEAMTHNVESVEDLQKDMEQMLAGVGIDPAEVQRAHNQIVGSIFNTEFSASNITAMVRENLREMAVVGFGQIKPGTRAEQAFIAEVQSEIYRTIQKELPDVAAHMPVLKSAPAAAERPATEDSSPPTTTGRGSARASKSDSKAPTSSRNVRGH